MSGYKIRRKGERGSQKEPSQPTARSPAPPTPSTEMAPQPVNSELKMMDVEEMLQQQEPLTDDQVRKWLTLSPMDIAMVNLIARGAVHPITKRPIRNVTSILAAIRMKLEASQPRPKGEDEKSGTINVTVTTLPMKGEDDAK